MNTAKEIPGYSEELRLTYGLTPDSVVLDAGGYRGDWASEINRRYGCAVRVLEPIKSFYRQIVDRFAGNHRVQVYNFGLGGVPGTADFGVQNDSTGKFAGATERAFPVKQLRATDAVAFTPASDGAPDAAVFDEPTTNYVTNPSFEVDASGWQAVGGGTSIARTTANFLWGIAALRATIAAAADNGAELSTTIPALPTEQWVASAYLSQSSGATRNYRISIRYLDSGGALIGAEVSSTRDIPTGSGWSRIFVDGGTAPALTTQLRVRIVCTESVAHTLDIDAVQAEKGAGQTWPTSYCDGTLGPAYAWTGTAHASTSTRAAGFNVLGALQDLARCTRWKDDGTFWNEFLAWIGARFALELSGDGGALALSTASTMLRAIASSGETGVTVGIKLRALGSTGRVAIVDQTAGAWANFRATMTGTQSVGTGVTTVVFPTDTGADAYDYGAHYNTGTGVFTAADAGMYLFGYSVHVTGVSDNQQIEAGIYRNATLIRGGGYSRLQSAGGTTLDLTGVTILELAATDTVDVRMLTETTAETVDGSSLPVNFWGIRIG